MNKRASSSAIIAGAKEAFQQSGYEKTAVENIFQATGLSLGEFDEAFGSKEECCLKVLKSYTSEVKKKL